MGAIHRIAFVGAVLCFILFSTGCDWLFAPSSDGESPCQNDPAECESTPDPSGFTQNLDCAPTGPLTVTLGQGIFDFQYVSSSADLVHHKGSQGGTHVDFALLVEGVDLEASPRLLVTLGHGGKDPLDFCSSLAPLESGGPSYLIALWAETYNTATNSYELRNRGLFGQPGCTVQGCSNEEICQYAVGCHPSVCWLDPSVSNDEEVLRCAEDCAGGVCVEQNPPTAEVGCETRECGNDGAGGLCGTCSDDQVCSLEGMCEESCTHEDSCGPFCTPCPTGAICDDGQCVVTSPQELMCANQDTLRTAILGKSKPLESDAEGRIVIPGLTVIDGVNPSSHGNVRVRVEDMCGNVGVDVMPL